jgi:hypothetical protein
MLLASDDARIAGEVADQMGLVLTRLVREADAVLLLRDVAAGLRAMNGCP